MKRNMMQRTMITLDDHLLRRVDELCEKEDRTRSWMIRHIIRSYMDAADVAAGLPIDDPIPVPVAGEEGTHDIEPEEDDA